MFREDSALSYSIIPNVFSPNIESRIKFSEEPYIFKGTISQQGPYMSQDLSMSSSGLEVWAVENCLKQHSITDLT